MKDTLKRLLKITSECREDMHEPDEQDVSAKVIGHQLDNAFGDDGGTYFRKDNSAYNPNNPWEFIVIIKNGKKTERFNLATLIALARKAQF